VNIDNLSGKIRDLEVLREEKDNLAESLESVKALIEAQEKEIISAMMDIAEATGLDGAEKLTVIVDGRRYGVSIKSYYSIKAENKDAAYPMLRDLGLGDLIKESVDQRVLTKALEAIAEDNGGELPGEYVSLPMSVYEKSAITRRKV